MAIKPRRTQLGEESDHDDSIDEDISTNSPEATNVSATFSSSTAPPTSRPLITSNQAKRSATSATVRTTGITGCFDTTDVMLSPVSRLHVTVLKCKVSQKV